MKIITKKKEKEMRDYNSAVLKLLAERVYEQTLKWCGNNDDAIPDKHKELSQMSEDISIFLK